MIGEMQLHIAEVENKFKISEVMGNANNSSNQEATKVEYFTDEELAEETEWIRVKNKSKKTENEHIIHSSPTAMGSLRTTTKR